ncbi:MAG: T9SS type A sorting domain-containing protein [Bacteroidia bacterium]|nr:T9SS type A sorting domain-containing protein [Bacteroidia bacterium]
MTKIIKFLLLVIISGVSFTVRSQINIFYHLTFQGYNRSFIVHVPASINSTSHLPLVFVLHRSGGNANLMLTKTNYNNIADTANFIVCYPNGVDGWADGLMATGADSAGVDDVGFISALIDTLKNHFNIDSSRVYAEGLSNGGFMCQRLACQLSGKIAAIAAVAATFAASMVDQCNPVRPVPVMIVHGTADPVIPESGGYFDQSILLLSTDSVVNLWKQLNGGCPQDSQITFFPQLGLSPSTSVVRYIYGLCNDHSEILWYSVIGGGHDWCGVQSNGSDPGVNLDIDVGVEGWKFFSHHQLAQNIITTIPGSSAPDVMDVDLFLRHRELDIFLNGTEKWVKVSLSDISGKQIRCYIFEFPSEMEQFSLPDLNTGIYLINIETDKYSFVKKISYIR